MSTLILLTSYTVYVMSEQKVLDTCRTAQTRPRVRYRQRGLDEEPDAGP